MKKRHTLSTIIFLAANLALPSLVQAQDQWSGSFDKLKGRIIRSMAVAPFDKNLIVVGNKGKAAGDATVSFKPVSFPSKDVRGFAVTESGVVFAATGNKGVLKSEDSGLNWTQTSLNKAFVWSVHADRAGATLLAASPSTGLYRGAIF